MIAYIISLFKKPTGCDKINAVLVTFTDNINELKEGIEKCNDEHQQLEQTISILEAEQKVISDKAGKAEILLNNLTKLLGE